MAALAILVAITAAQPPPPPGLAPLSVPETRRLLTALVGTTVTDPQTAAGWSLWRRRHRATAGASHHKRRMIIESEHVNRRT